MSQPPVTPWAKRATSEDPGASLQAFQEGLAVHLVATPRTAFKTCSSDEALTAVVERNRHLGYDFLPVTGSAGEGTDRRDRIVGLIGLVPFMEGERHSDRTVNEKMDPLWEGNLIGADASILTFVRDADRQNCRLVVSGPEISGLVSLSDLQRLPVRAALFAMITHLEMVMADYVRSEFGQSEDWMLRLSPKRQENVHTTCEEARSKDAFVDTLLSTQFCDKVAIIRKSPGFHWPKGNFEDELNEAQSLRDNLAHANDYAATRDAAAKVCKIVRLMDKWIERLTLTQLNPT